ncbi:alpha/beta fold hydrolase [Foetidibacter luteolus]|uniref:alpha/beta fold hydrolase n=1 Tax=Foetidibacter luteolus TaxID=2608880 RepID=UPI00129B05B1|nr:alpha/beta hydrolase [Foetidibacter luteolus]
MEKQITYQNRSINYRVEGEGKTLVLVHGFPEDNTVWHNQVAALKTHCRLIVPDLPGSGKSAFNGSLTTMEAFADVLYAILQQEQVTGAIVCGHSMGGYITLAFAEKYPQLLLGFGLVHSTAFADSEEKKQNRLKSIKMMGEYGAPAFLKSMVPNMFSAGYKALHADKVLALIEAGNNIPVQALQQYYTAMMNRPGRTAVLQSSKLPVLFILGKEDTAAPLSDVLQQVHLPETSHVHILQNAGHMGMWEEPELTNQYLLAFTEAV